MMLFNFGRGTTLTINRLRRMRITSTRRLTLLTYVV